MNGTAECATLTRQATAFISVPHARRFTQHTSKITRQRVAKRTARAVGQQVKYVRKREMQI